jgi:hypothetical protein
MGPINYLGGMPNVNLTEEFTQGLKYGTDVRKLQLEQEAMQQKMLRQQQYQQGVAAALKGNDPQAFTSLTLQYPEFREAIKNAFDMQGDSEKKDQGSFFTQTFSALNAGRPDIAQAQLEKRIQARQNSGLDASREENMLRIAKENPEQLKGYMSYFLSNIDDNFAKNYGALGAENRAQEQAPAELRTKVAGADKAESDATTAGVTAKYADQDAQLDLKKKGWDIQALQADIDYKRQSSRIAAMNAVIAREGNDLKRQELKMKIDEAVRERDTKLRDKVAAAESGASNIDNMLNTIERIKKNPRLDAVVGGIEGRMPAVRDESTDAIALIDTLGSQAFLAQIPNIKGMGALSNAEGEKLQSALQNLSRTQSEKQFRTNLDEAARLLKKGRENLAKSTGVPLGKPDTPAAPGARPPLDSFRGK